MSRDRSPWLIHEWDQSNIHHRIYTPPVRLANPLLGWGFTRTSPLSFLHWWTCLCRPLKYDNAVCPYSGTWSCITEYNWWGKSPKWLLSGQSVLDFQRQSPGYFKTKTYFKKVVFLFIYLLIELGIYSNLKVCYVAFCIIRPECASVSWILKATIMGCM